MNEKQYEKLIASCTEHCTSPYCFLKMFFAKQHPNERVVIQIKCIEIAKWTWSAEVGEDIGWHVAMERWVSEGYAKEFATVFENMLVEEYTKEIILEIFKETVRLVKMQEKIKNGEIPF